MSLRQDYYIAECVLSDEPLEALDRIWVRFEKLEKVRLIAQELYYQIEKQSGQNANWKPTGVVEDLRFALQEIFILEEGEK